MIPVRLSVGLMIFFSAFFMYMLRANFSINMLAMVNDPQIEQPDYGPRYNWTAYEQSLVLGAYFWGYALTSIPAGLLIDKYGYAKTTVGVSFVLGVAMTLAAPWAAVSLTVTIVLRFLMGLTAGGVVPAWQRIISLWSPPNEKGKFVATMFGTDIGTVVTWTICGVLIERFGWRWAFFGPAILAGIFTILWSVIVYDSPLDHPWIGQREREHIVDSQAGNVARATAASVWPPFGQIIRSAPFWVLLLLHFGHMWGMYFLLTAAPMFLNTVLGFDLTATGFFASFPYLLRLMTGLAFGALGDLIKTRGWLRTVTVRKAGTILSHILPGLLIAAIPYVSGDPFACVGCITLSFGFNGAVSLTNYQNSHDLSPNYAATVFSMINGVATTTGFLSPLVVAYFTRDANTIDEWSKVFFVGATIYIVPSLLFMLMGSAEIQPWNDCNPHGHESTMVDVSRALESRSAEQLQVLTKEVEKVDGKIK